MTLACFLRYMSANDGRPFTNVRYLFDKMKHIRRVEVVENTKAKNDVEAPILFGAEISDVVQDKLNVLKPEYVLSKSCLLNVRGPSFNRNHAGAMSSELQPVESL